LERLTRIDSDLLKQVKHLSVDTEKSIAMLIKEAIVGLLEKYEEKSTK